MDEDKAFARFFWSIVAAGLLLPCVPTLAAVALVLFVAVVPVPTTPEAAPVEQTAFEPTAIPNLPPSSSHMPGYRPEAVPPVPKPWKRDQGNIPPSKFSRVP